MLAAGILPVLSPFNSLIAAGRMFIPFFYGSEEFNETQRAQFRHNEGSTN
jgi:hypothetical protein